MSNIRPPPYTSRRIGLGTWSDGDEQPETVGYASSVAKVRLKESESKAKKNSTPPVVLAIIGGCFVKRMRFVRNMFFYGYSQY